MACYHGYHRHRDSRGRFAPAVPAPIPVPDVSDMVADILALNIRESALLVIKREIDNYQILSGFRRMEAARYVSQGLADIETYAAKHDS